MSFIKGNLIISIKNEVGIQTSNFLNFCAKAESKYQKISSCYKYGIPRQIYGQIFTEKNSFSVSNFRYNYLIWFISLMTE
jgi:hypothetical protein